ncbi:signal peptidase II [Mycoplasmopsis iners]|uniref:signal peptidase II n=1 Tax=Mycoplasmopsis iners TaxID=76630 RepID=UPI000690AE3A|nr:signal peptidase II [Mycoplasmopsis iners]
MEKSPQKKSSFGLALKVKFKEKIAEIKSNPKQLIIKYAIFTGVLVILLLIDQLTKNLIFQWDSTHTDGLTVDVKDYVIIGTRSVGHRGVTILPWKDNMAVIVIVQLISVLIALFLLSVPLFSNKKLIIIICSFILAGDLGNFIDRCIYDGGMVKDVFFIPFLESWLGRQLGTFNFADVCIIVGSIGIMIYYIVMLFVNKESEDKKSINDESLNTFINSKKDVETSSKKDVETSEESQQS